MTSAVIPFEHAFETRLTEAVGSFSLATSSILVTGVMAVMLPRGLSLPDRDHNALGQIRLWFVPTHRDRSQSLFLQSRVPSGSDT
ncbi:MAG: hypothetical protein OXD42_11415 [Rhodospirillaceae bacterium]|nr:hypothetical protein [Rhodospirillaceae bacterium]